MPEAPDSSAWCTWGRHCSLQGISQAPQRSCYRVSEDVSCLPSRGRCARPASSSLAERDGINVMLGIHRCALATSHKSMRNVLDEREGDWDEEDSDEGGQYHSTNHNGSENTARD